MAAIELPVAWYVYRAGHRHGPMPEMELALLAKTNVLLHSDLIWCEGMPDWVEAGVVSGLLPTKHAPPPPKFGGLTEAYLDARESAVNGRQGSAASQRTTPSDAAHQPVAVIATDQSTDAAMLPSRRGRSAPFLQLEIAAAPAM